VLSGGTLTERSPCIAVLAAVASLHALTVYLLINASLDGAGQSENFVIEAAVIPADQRIPNPPPPLPPVMLDASIPDTPPPLHVSVDLPIDQAPPATHAIDTRDPSDLAGKLPEIVNASVQKDPIPVVRPRPITGPRGADRYPNASLKAKESGTVEMNICVSPAGRVDSVEVAQSSGFPRLDQAAVGIAAEYRFQPATREGQPVAACAHYRIVFKVEA
jgi:periplasmic protein TonB